MKFETRSSFGIFRWKSFICLLLGHFIFLNIWCWWWWSKTQAQAHTQTYARLFFPSALFMIVAYVFNLCCAVCDSDSQSALNAKDYRHISLRCQAIANAYTPPIYDMQCKMIKKLNLMPAVFRLWLWYFCIYFASTECHLYGTR